MPPRIENLRRGRVALVNLPDRPDNPHHGVILSVDVASQSFEIAVSTGDRLGWHEAQGYGNPVLLDWSAKAARPYCTGDWPRGLSRYYGAFVRTYTLADLEGDGVVPGQGVPEPYLVHMEAVRKKHREVLAAKQARQRGGGGASRSRP